MREQAYLPYLRAGVVGAIAVVMLGAAAPVSAGAPRRFGGGVQGDATVVEQQGIGRDPALDLIQGSGAQWVRMFAIENEWMAGERQRFIEAAAAAHARGLRVMVTLFRWRGMDGTERPGVTVPEWERFVSSVVPALAPYVDAWGTTNEPNHIAFAPKATPRCRVDQRRSAHSVVVRNGKRVVISYKRVKTGRGKYVKRVRWQNVRRGTHKRIVRNGRASYVRAERRARYLRRVIFKRQRHGNYVRKIRPAKKTIWLSTDYEVSECVRLTWALAYRPIHDAAAQIIRAADPSATLIAGDLAPGGSNSDFFHAMFEAAPGPVDADALGFHPYMPGWDDPTQVGAPDGTSIASIEDIVARTRSWHKQGLITGGQAWITEFGFAPKAPAGYWTSALDRAEAAGVPVTILYELTQHPEPGRWDTGLLERDGTPRPSWHAVAGWLTRR